MMKTKQSIPTDARQLLDQIGFKWKTSEHLHRLHSLADASSSLVGNVIGCFALVDTPHSLPPRIAGRWVESLIRHAVEIAMFPFEIPVELKIFDDFVGKWREWNESVASAIEGTPLVLSSDKPSWAISSAVRAAWNIEFSVLGNTAHIGSRASDSAHRAALRSPLDLSLDWVQYQNALTDDVAAMGSAWDKLIASWPTESIQTQCSAARAALPSELHKLEEILGFKTWKPNADFTEMAWGTDRFHFKLGMQSQTVKCLWEERTSSGLGLHQKTIGERIGSNSDRFRLIDLFKDHPAWGTMIVTSAAGTGVYELSAPK